jgi:hypothetical protein
MGNDFQVGFPLVGIVANDPEVFPDRLFMAVIFAVKVSKSVRERRLVEAVFRIEKADPTSATEFCKWHRYLGAYKQRSDKQ